MTPERGRIRPRGREDAVFAVCAETRLDVVGMIDVMAPIGLQHVDPERTTVEIRILLGEARDELRLMPAYVARTGQGNPRKTARKEKSTNKRYHSSTAADSGWVEARNQVAKLPPAVPSRHTKPLQ